MKKLLIIMIFVPISENYCTNGEFFLKLKNFGALQYEVRIETIAGEFYFDESYHPVKPINTLIFQNSDNDIVKADLIFDHNNNGTKDINGNEFLIYYGKYKIIVKFSNQEYWMIIDYQDCQISSAGGDVIDVYFYFTYVENKFIKTNSGFSYNSEDFTSKTFNFTMNQLGKEIIEYCFKIDLKLKNILEDNLNSSFGSIFIDGVEYFSDTTVSLKHNNYYLFYDEKNLPNSLNMFRDWKIVETQTNIKYPNPANLKFIENAQLFGEYYPTYPLTVTNYLEGVNGGSYSVTWQAANKTYTLNSGEVYFAFDNNKTRDKYHINVAQTIQSQYGTDWQFQNWDDGSTNATITNLAVKVPTTRTAYYKGNLRSDDAAAFANSGQRKVITTPNGNMYLTYESMNSVWLEKSTDNGSTWQLMNNGKPINSGIVSGKSPSLSLDYDDPNNNYSYNTENNFYLVYQEYIVDTEIDNILQILYFKDGINTPEFSNEIPDSIYTGNINLEPVIAKTFNKTNSLLLVYKLSSSASSNPGLYYLLGKHNPHTETNITWYGTASTYIANTSNNSNNPSIAVNSAYLSYTETHLVWQEGTTKIRYYELSDPTGSNAITPTAYSEISSGSGYTYNEKPTITINANYPQVSWIGTKSVYSGKGEARTITTYRKVIKRGKSWYGWGFFYETGNDVINISSNNTSDNNYVIAWAEENTPGSYVDKFVKNISRIKSFNYLGTTTKYLQLSNGATTNNMYATTFSVKTLPYTFEQSSSIGSKLQKSGMIASGRQGVVYRENAEFYFAIGDIYLNGDLVEFEDVVDTTYINDLQHLNGYLQTKVFDINNNSSVTYSVLYGLTDSLKAGETLGGKDEVNFKVELIDAQSGNIIGAYDDVAYSKNSLDSYDNIAYTINTEGAGNRKVKLRLAVNDNLNGGYGFSKIFAEGNVLGKFSNPVALNYQGTMEVKEYSLAQNYPNPFNPSTTIKYQLPQSGNVKLVIYDMLGREVKTLVNGFRQKGKYEISFDASRLSSGVYIYRIEANEFSASRKMMLIK